MPTQEHQYALSENDRSKAIIWYLFIHQLTGITIDKSAKVIAPYFQIFVAVVWRILVLNNARPSSESVVECFVKDFGYMMKHRPNSTIIHAERYEGYRRHPACSAMLGLSNLTIRDLNTQASVR
ncbi:hypothetical protein PAAG_11250 [Paracoccidioides lutzii Pb01]|uniref:Uncharacterized protein n=1 Tax=Paracoccidioides lutzii (strain ATCC MYA-826 / Pb01) TaxID=502779 RepID=A0A0A2VMK1_PARBA|nr:hypothetical protein PAAG_11250 [Paracoccidioides lutzii Pb01]KGQ02069.1 hypothetical protein PAAG_11250 [Paracoccidioides lutzii Pb01]